MKQVSFEEIGGVVASFVCGSAVDCGAVVKMSGSGEVSGCEDDDVFCGVALADSDNLVAVQVGGFCTVATTGTVAVGYTALVADGEGGVQADTEGREYLVISVDSTAKTAIICL